MTCIPRIMSKTKLNLFRIGGHSTSAYVPITNLTNAIFFRDLTISDCHNELMVLLVGAQEGVAHEW